MSSYFQSRRRFSEQDASVPHSHWRMRVSSLMLDSESRVSSLGDKREERFDWRRRVHGEGSVSRESKVATNESIYRRASEVKDSSSLTSRRERFERTVSDGHLKFRVRLSKTNGPSKSFDEEQSDDVDYVRRRRRRWAESEETQTAEETSLTERENSTSFQDDKEKDTGTRFSHIDGRIFGASADKNVRKKVWTDLPEHIGQAPSLDQNECADDFETLSACAFPEEHIVKREDCESCEKSLANSSSHSDSGLHTYGIGAIPKQKSQVVLIDIETNELETLKSRPTTDINVGSSDHTNAGNKLQEKKCSNVSETGRSPGVSAKNDKIVNGGANDPATDMVHVSSTTTEPKEPALLTYTEGAKASSFNDYFQCPDPKTKEKFPPPGALFFSNFDDLPTIVSAQMDNPSTVSAACDSVVQTTSEEAVLPQELDERGEDENRNQETENTVKEIIEKLVAEEVGIAGASGLLSDSELAILKQEAEMAMRDDGDTGASSKSSRLPVSTLSPSVSGQTQSVVPSDDSGEVAGQGGNAGESEGSDDYTWADLPFVLLEDVFTLLTPKERHQASMVCRQWYDLFYSPRVWETFILMERTLTKKRFNLYKGYQRELCPGKTQLCFRRVGSFFKRIIVTPITDYFNLYEFLRILAAFLQYQEEHGKAGMPLLHTFDLTFACASQGHGGMLVHGTGGQILAMIEELLIRMNNLKHLKLNQLMVDVMDIQGLFNAIAQCFGESLNTLEIINLTKIPVALLDLAQFRNLIKLTVSPQHISEEVLVLLAGINLMQLHLVQDRFTCDCDPVHFEAWKLLREMAPWMKVYLELCGNTKSQLLIQPRAPVYGIFLRTPYSRLDSDLAMSIVEQYSKTLRYFVQECLPRVHGPRSFHGRCDSSLLYLVRRCTALHTLVIRERISTCTLILVASEGTKLSTLLVRQHALIKRCDWPRHGEWSREFFFRLQQASLDYKLCTDEVCKHLKKRWRPLADKQFMRLKIVPRMDAF